MIGAYLPNAEALDDREPFHGMIDDLLVWERALTSTEVSLLHEFESNLHEPYPNDEDGLVPFVVTEFHKAGFNGEYEFGGRILTEGSSPVIEAGVFLSKSIVGENLIWLPAQVNEQTLEFFVSTDDLEPGVRYYYRAYARNSAGKRRKLEEVRDPAGRFTWCLVERHARGRRGLAFFGLVRRVPMFGQTEWVYHAQIGWVFVVPDEERGLWLWHREWGWLWTQRGTWPYLWRNQVSAWLYFLGKHEGSPVFYDYRTSDYLILP